ncbi:MAG: TIGR03790 family protein [Gammaproteobacteria bacterium]|nr:TIGR03790 family protein [Gammaproteobacteria bacterium]
MVWQQWLIWLALLWSVTLPCPAAVTPDSIAVVVNQNDPDSIATGQYYLAARRIPPQNLFRIDLPTLGLIDAATFTTAKTQLDAALPTHIQFLALAWTQPFRVDCMGITAAFSLGFSPAFCATGCTPTRPSPYFGSQSSAPFAELGVRPSMLLAGSNLAAVQALIERGKLSDGTFPTGGDGYVLATSDAQRSVRAQRSVLVNTKDHLLRKTQREYLQNTRNILFYFTGAEQVPMLNSNQFLPGAVGDHLTSFGGVLVGGSQMSALRWLDAGATGSYGTVVEPCNFPHKFPLPEAVSLFYQRGDSLIEAYWKSVMMPGQGVFVGEPLAAPFSRRQQ